jgi:hypothetical protein
VAAVGRDNGLADVQAEATALETPRRGGTIELLEDTRHFVR